MHYRTKPTLSAADLDPLWRAAWGSPIADSYDRVLARSLTYVTAGDGERIAGFVNVAWDGGVHAFILDTCVHPDYRRRGIATRLVAEARKAARDAGAEWLHVDYEPHLDNFYRSCGFRPSPAGVIRLLP